MNKPPMAAGAIAPPAVRTMKTPAMITLGLLCKLGAIVAAVSDAQLDPKTRPMLDDAEVQALLADMRRTGLLPPLPANDPR